MRTTLAILMLTLSAIPAWAQSNTAGVAAQPPAVRGCRPFDAPPLVTMKLRTGQTLRGTLTCLGDEAELAAGGNLSRIPLTDILKIAEPRDPVWNGPVIGAGLGVLFWALCDGHCDNAYMARATVYYALIGLVLDAAVSSNKTIYAGTRGPALSFRVRF